MVKVKTHVENKVDHRCKPVICLSGGTVFGSVKEAAEVLGMEYWRLRAQIAAREMAEDGKIYLYVSDMASEVGRISEALRLAERTSGEMRTFMEMIKHLQSAYNDN